MYNEQVVDTYEQITYYWPWWARVRSQYNNSIRYLKSYSRDIDRTSSWIRFPFYHHVFEDEIEGFCRQLDYLKNYGDFMSLDTAVNILHTGAPIDGRYFCITFDDGIDSCYDHAFPILNERGISAAFFVVPDYMSDLKGKENRIVKQMPRSKMKFRFFTWDECREMKDCGMIIGSHTCSHVMLSQISDDLVQKELKISREIIERKIGDKCDHFACPFGVPGINYIQNHHELMAINIGYKSFLAVHRGIMSQGDSPYFIRRDFTYANWDCSLLKYYFGFK